jgi:hypothetical protein
MAMAFFKRPRHFGNMGHLLGGSGSFVGSAAAPEKECNVNGHSTRFGMASGANCPPPPVFPSFMARPKP